MNNFEHEIECPKNRSIYCFLWQDYFHDSEIRDISFDQHNKHLCLTIESCRDREKKWNTLKGNNDLKRDYIKTHKDEFIYYLTFKGVEYFHMERMPSCNDYINGRFKDTALLREINEEVKRKCYHFRIQLDDGYCDIVFKDFIIRKRIGRVFYYNKDYNEPLHYYQLIDDDVDNATHGDDICRLIAMQKLWIAKHPKLLQMARENILLDNDFPDSRLYSAYLLGKLGDETDLPILYDMYFNIESDMMADSICRCSTLLPKRNIMDAIEDIKYRCNKSMARTL